MEYTRKDSQCKPSCLEPTKEIELVFIWAKGCISIIEDARAWIQPCQSKTIKIYSACRSLSAVLSKKKIWMLMPVPQRLFYVLRKLFLWSLMWNRWNTIKLYQSCIIITSLLYFWWIAWIYIEKNDYIYSIDEVNWSIQSVHPITAIIFFSTAIINKPPTTKSLTTWMNI